MKQSDAKRSHDRAILAGTAGRECSLHMTRLWMLEEMRRLER